MIRKALPRAFKGLKEKDAELSEDGMSLIVGKTVRLKQIEHEDKKFDAELKYLKISIDGEYLITESCTETEVSPGIYSECSAVGKYRIKLLNLPDGKQTLSYEEVGEPSVYKSTRHAKGIDILHWIIVAIGAIVTIIVGVLTAGWGFLAAAACMALVAGAFAVIDQIPNIIEYVQRGKAPPIDLLVANATAPVHWAGEQAFRLTNIVLNGSLILGGKFA